MAVETIAVGAEDVYRPQHDSWLLIEALERSNTVPCRRVVDLCAGSGVVAVAAADLGASAVTALDISPCAVRSTQANSLAAQVTVDARLGSWTQALEHEPFDVVVCNPPYVPVAPDVDAASIPAAGPMASWNGGPDGRLVLDPLCRSAGALLARGGSLFLVQSEFADVRRSVQLLRETGLSADIYVTQRIPFGPVLHSQARWLRQIGRLTHARAEEELVVIRADKS
ncbi:HemK2/MTQ2 family protein methyltransferase [Mycolicibacterium neworleansense]|uniref:Methylase n=1 Tax=Mycolicibacterium neworleansense TaxID=146018 RepID=A0A0H5RNG2_9MYCO|nr:HemK2/MTQ2 family protein methyltransferase [Mycolicibacterium neworleansense]MCV7364917.1 methyltransferase [Mycolicibacterium neworleansense]CRZ15715.1 methylase [Mycolicibacterium neworleansense]